ncbi:TPA: baseplate J/gp47 family protein [Yersinia enterocolitica]|nr:baseplate J/gp47 family protein [Yersinia enterocolitica]HDM8296216.1 baseplate J/gp47 family protein [Yersinia enterocolitica]HDM8321548.1 baseplate J/gp47 family protein [Yersinia enterocolitica]HDM8333679.1 baseplate J/gp47 family protein [Yersinia enterocolitica]
MAQYTLTIVRAALNDEDVRPVVDRVTVQSAAIVDYQIDAVIYIYPGPEAEPVRAASQARLVNEQRRAALMP